MNENKAKSKLDWDRVFGTLASASFGTQLVSMLVLLAEALVFLLTISGIWGVALSNVDILIFLVLLGGGVVFLVFIWFLGPILRLNTRIRRIIIGRGVGNIAADSAATRTILALFAGATLFVLCAGVYGYYVLWKYVLNGWGQALLGTFGLLGQPLYELGMLVAYFALGAIAVCFILQLLSVIVNSVADDLVAGVK